MVIDPDSHRGVNFAGKFHGLNFGFSSINGTFPAT